MGSESHDDGQGLGSQAGWGAVSVGDHQPAGSCFPTGEIHVFTEGLCAALSWTDNITLNPYNNLGHGYYHPHAQDGETHFTEVRNS